MPQMTKFNVSYSISQEIPILKEKNLQVLKEKVKGTGIFSKKKQLSNKFLERKQRMFTNWKSRKPFHKLGLLFEINISKRSIPCT